TSTCDWRLKLTTCGSGSCTRRRRGRNNSSGHHPLSKCPFSSSSARNQSVDRALNGSVTAVQEGMVVMRPREYSNVVYGGTIGESRLRCRYRSWERSCSQPPQAVYVGQP